ncbi:MAG: hypothetical protein RL007_880, partial [Bacteroidota bacterium]
MSKVYRLKSQICPHRLQSRSLRFHISAFQSLHPR